MKFDELVEYLKENDFRRISAEGANKWMFTNKDYTLQVTVEEKQIKLTVEDEEKIKERLKSLGYLD